MRGEHPIAWADANVMAGSSPHARGALRRLVVHARLAGIIPACAGSTIRYVAGALAPGDHPRMRGEHTYSAVAPWPQVGSSPHAWGALSGLRPVVVDVGITPACAGSTRSSPCGASPRGDHPRMRGEHAELLADLYTRKGSSPHARGARGSFSHAINSGGIIPACAGSTRPSTATCCSTGDHPRMRGEHKAATTLPTAMPGSSPHARGALY